MPATDGDCPNLGDGHCSNTTCDVSTISVEAMNSLDDAYDSSSCCSICSSHWSYQYKSLWDEEKDLYSDEEFPSESLASDRKHYRTGHTYRLKPKPRYSQFRLHPVIYKYVNLETVDDQPLVVNRRYINDLVDDLICDGFDIHAADAQFLAKDAFPDTPIAHSMNKKNRWEIPDIVDRIIHNETETEREIDISMGIRHCKPSYGWDTVMTNCSSYHSTNGYKKRYSYAKRSNVIFADLDPGHCADPNTLIDNLRPPRQYSEHDWKPEYQKLLHNQHYRGVQRKQALRSGYKNTMKNILKTEATERAETESRQRLEVSKAEVIYDVNYPLTPTTSDSPTLQTALNKAYINVNYKNKKNRSISTALKTQAFVQMDIDEYHDYCSTETYLPCEEDNGYESVSYPCEDRISSDITLADYLTPAKKRCKKRKLVRKDNKPFVYEPERRSNIETVSKKKHASATDSDDSGFSDDFTLTTTSRIDTFCPRLPSYQTVMISSDQMAPKRLQEEFGDKYMEGVSQPRRFLLDVTAQNYERGTELSHLVFQIVQLFDVGLAEVLVRLQTQECTMENGTFLSELSEYDGLLTMSDIIKSARLHSQLEYQTLSFPQFIGKAKVDMNQLNTALGVDIKVHTRDEAVKKLMKHQSATQASQDEDLVFVKPLLSTETGANALLCDICYEECNVEQFTNSWTALNECGHVYCNRCWCQHLVHLVRSRHTILHCPAQRCNTEVDECTIASLLPNDVYSLYQKLQPDVLIDSSPDWQWCPNTRCGRVVEKCQVDSRYNVNVTCRCGETWCFSCQKDAHWPASCKQAEEYTENLKEVGAAIVTYQVPISSVEIKRCPKCRYPIEKYNGCNFMFCSMCATNFCWLCLQDVSYIHTCRYREVEEIELIDLLPAGFRWFENACARRLRWNAQRFYIIQAVKLSLGQRNTKYNCYNRRKVFNSPTCERALSAARLYNYVAENVMVVYMNCRKRDILAELKLSMQNLNYVIESLERIIITSCCIGKISPRDVKRTNNLIRVGDNTLHDISRYIPLQQRVIRDKKVVTTKTKTKSAHQL